MHGSIGLGVDVGGTFTDIVLLFPDGKAVPKKVLSSPPNFNEAIKRGVVEALGENGADASVVRSFTHGATVATNAIITRTGAATGLIATKGFRDVLEIRRMRMHKLCDIDWEKPAPLVPRHLRREVPSRVDPRTGEDSPLDERAVREAVQRLPATGRMRKTCRLPVCGPWPVGSRIRLECRTDWKSRPSRGGGRRVCASAVSAPSTAGFRPT